MSGNTIPEKCQKCSVLEMCKEYGFFELLNGCDAQEGQGDLGSTFLEPGIAKIEGRVEEIARREQAIENVQRAQVVAEEASEAFGKKDMHDDDVEPVETMGKVLIDFLDFEGLGVPQAGDLFAATFGVIYELGYVRAMKDMEEAKSDGS